MQLNHHKALIAAAALLFPALEGCKRHQHRPENGHVGVGPKGTQPGMSLAKAYIDDKGRVSLHQDNMTRDGNVILNGGKIPYKTVEDAVKLASGPEKDKWFNVLVNQKGQVIATLDKTQNPVTSPDLKALEKEDLPPLPNSETMPPIPSPNANTDELKSEPKKEEKKETPVKPDYPTILPPPKQDTGR